MNPSLTQSCKIPRRKQLSRVHQRQRLTQSEPVLPTRFSVQFQPSQQRVTVGSVSPPQPPAKGHMMTSTRTETVVVDVGKVEHQPKVNNVVPCHWKLKRHSEFEKWRENDVAWIEQMLKQTECQECKGDPQVLCLVCIENGE